MGPNLLLLFYCFKNKQKRQLRAVFYAKIASFMI